MNETKIKNLETQLDLTLLKMAKLQLHAEALQQQIKLESRITPKVEIEKKLKESQNALKVEHEEKVQARFKEIKSKRSAINTDPLS